MLERTLILGSFADIPGLDAWLVSWIAGPTSLVALARGLKLAITLCSAAASQYVALAGCSSGSERHVAQDTGRIRTLTTLLEQHGIPYYVPHTVAFVIADVSILGGGDTVATACTRGGVRVLSGSKFDSPGFMRITAANEHFEQGVERLNVVLISLKKEGQSARRAVD
jgi:aspartate/methionine/tyrosine aminotransferase